MMLEEDKYRVLYEGYIIPYAGFCKEFELRGV